MHWSSGRATRISGLRIRWRSGEVQRVYTDISSQCASRGLSADGTLTCERLLSSVPTKIFSLNTGLNTLQFQSLSINPYKPTAELLGGTQDNGTWRYQGTKTWLLTMAAMAASPGSTLWLRARASTPTMRPGRHQLPRPESAGLGLDLGPLLCRSGGKLGVLYPNHRRSEPGQGGSMFAGLQAYGGLATMAACSLRWISTVTSSLRLHHHLRRLG